jgi:hypothetical protein
MRVVNRICIKTEEFVDGPDRSIELKRGQEYVTSADERDGEVTVFSTYWFRAPVELFAGPEPLGGSR